MIRNHLPLGLLLLLFATPSFAQSIIDLESDSGDFIGGGVNQQLAAPFTTEVGTRVIEIQHDSGFNFSFEAPNDREFARGAFFDAQRTPFRGPLNPGISVSSSGRGCNTIAGEFYIYEIVIDPSEPVLAMDFVQRCEQGTAELRGKVRINSDLPTEYTLPFAVARYLSEPPLEGTAVTLNGSSSFSNNSAISSYEWEQTGGPLAEIDNRSAANPVLQLPTDLAVGGETLTFALTVIDGSGESDTTSISLEVASKSDPRTFFTMSSDAGDYIGAGLDWEYTSADSTFGLTRNFDNGVSVSINGATWWNAEFAAPDDAELEVGEYDTAERFPFQSAGIAGLTISGDGRGCNTSTGSFNVQQLEWEQDEPTAFRATFSQFCESASAPELTGEVSVNAVHESVPDADAGQDFEILENQLANLNGSRSFDAGGILETFEWSTARSDISIENNGNSRANFLSPSLPDRVNEQSIEVTLLVTDDEGYKAMDTVSILIMSNNSRPSAVDDTFSAFANTTTTFFPLANDTDSDGSLAADSIDVIAAPSLGNVAIMSDGSIEYTHTADNLESDSFTYTIIDNDGAISEPATVTLNISEMTPVQPAPVPTPNVGGGGGGGSLSPFSLAIFVMTLLSVQGFRFKQKKD